MVTKKCCECKRIKEITEFHKRKDSYRSQCKTCRQLEAADYWKRRGKELRKKFRNRHLAYRAKYRDAARKWLFNYLKDKECIDCGNTNPVVLDFDHVRGKKKRIVSAMLLAAYSLKTVMKEIAKCDIRCANCHRIKTAKQQGQYKSRRMKYGR